LETHSAHSYVNGWALVNARTETPVLLFLYYIEQSPWLWFFVAH